VTDYLYILLIYSVRHRD